MTPKISFLVPTYRRSQLVRRCIESILASPSRDFELLVSNNCSPDDTREVLESFSDARLRHWAHPTNVGIENNLMSLVEAAKGEWVVYLTDDDYMLRGAADRLLAMVADAGDVGVILTSVDIVDIEGTYLRTYRFKHSGTRTFPAGREALLGFFWAAHILSRITMRREWIDLEGVRATMGSLFPQMYMVGSIVKHHPGRFIDESLVGHTAGNETDWEYTTDFMVGTRITMIKHLLPAPVWDDARAALLSQLREEIRETHLPATAHQSIGAFLKYQGAVLRNSEIAFSGEYWSLLIDFLVGGAWRRMKRRLASG